MDLNVEKNPGAPNHIIPNGACRKAAQAMVDSATCLQLKVGQREIQRMAQGIPHASHRHPNHNRQ